MKQPFNLQSPDGGLLTSIKVGTGSLGSTNRLSLAYSYDSFGNIKTLGEAYNGGGTSNHSFAYDAQNRVTGAFDQTFGWSAAGNLSSKPVPDTSGSSQAYSYAWSQDGANPHGVKWVGVGQGATINRTVKVRAKRPTEAASAKWSVAVPDTDEAPTEALRWASAVALPDLSVL